MRAGGRTLGGAVAVIGASSGALRTTYRRRAAGSTARTPSPRTSMEKLRSASSRPLTARAILRAFCQLDASTVWRSGESASVLPNELISTNQRMRVGTRDVIRPRRQVRGVPSAQGQVNADWRGWVLAAAERVYDRGRNRPPWLNAFA
jgi:hypothetical protein